MAIIQDLVAYHKSIGFELNSSKDRIRDLIGNAHWLTDGEHKESILRKVISSFAPETFRIGQGFVCYPDSQPPSTKSSTQIDILITSKFHPTLYKDSDLHLVTPDTVHAIAEVKTELQQGENLRGVLRKLSSEVKRIRTNSRNVVPCWAGLFVYDAGNIGDENLLKALQEITEDLHSTINCVAIGRQLFARFWPLGHPDSGLENVPMWHSYELDNLAQPYFISNLISHLSPRLQEETWFPIPGTKEVHKRHYARLGSDRVDRF